MAIHALHDAALIRYARCFKAGRRDAFQITDDWLKGLPPRLRQAHRDALSLRDKHIAHSINDWEVNVPVAVVARTNVAATVRSIAIRQMRMMMLGTDPLENLHEVAKTLADRVVAEMQQLQREMLEALRRTPPRELQRRAPRVFPTPGRRKVGSDRGRR
jgi:hypothetical protein